MRSPTDARGLPSAERTGEEARDINRVQRYLAGSGVVIALLGGTVVYVDSADTSTARAVGESAAPPDDSISSASSTTTTTTLPSTTTTGPPTTPPTTAAPPPPTDAAPVPAPSGGETTAASSRGWSLVAADEFDGPAVDSGRWELYDSAGNGGVGLRRPSAISQGGGELRITGRGDVSGGMSWRGGRTYGRWEIRARIDKGNGYAPAVLLWPSSNNWPAEGEIDLTEVPKGDRRQSHFTVHWGAENSQDGFASTGDFSQWHTFAVEWLPDHVTFFLDGKALYTTTDPPTVPRWPMQLAIQNDVGPYSWIPARDASTPAEVALHVDWVRLYT